MARHKHRFVAIPITGQNAGTGKEKMFGWRVECEVCYKPAELGDIVEEIKASHWREVKPENELVSITVR